MPITMERMLLVLDEVDSLAKTLERVRTQAKGGLVNLDQAEFWLTMISDTTTPNLQHSYHERVQLKANLKENQRKRANATLKRARERQAEIDRGIAPKTPQSMEEIARAAGISLESIGLAPPKVDKPANAPRPLTRPVKDKVIEHPTNIDPVELPPPTIPKGLEYLVGKRTKHLGTLTPEQAEAIEEGPVLEYDDSVISEDDLAAMNKGLDLPKAAE